jgi:hypothetical protein
VIAAFVGVTVRNLGRTGGGVVLKGVARTQRFAFQARRGEPIELPISLSTWFLANCRSMRNRLRAAGKSLISW